MGILWDGDCEGVCPAMDGMVLPSFPAPVDCGVAFQSSMIGLEEARRTDSALYGVRYTEYSSAQCTG